MSPLRPANFRTARLRSVDLEKCERTQFSITLTKEEDAKEELYSLVALAQVSPEGLKGLGARVIDEAD